MHSFIKHPFIHQCIHSSIPCINNKADEFTGTLNTATATHEIRELLSSLLAVIVKLDEIIPDTGSLYTLSSPPDNIASEPLITQANIKVSEDDVHVK